MFRLQFPPGECTAIKARRSPRGGFSILLHGASRGHGLAHRARRLPFGQARRPSARALGDDQSSRTEALGLDLAACKQRKAARSTRAVALAKLLDGEQFGLHGCLAFKAGPLNCGGLTRPCDAILVEWTALYQKSFGCFAATSSISRDLRSRDFQPRKLVLARRWLFSPPGTRA